ncbi:MAG TPA: helix-turn-helix transcriptional regulator [Ktedonobacteraceae bacterium]|nr:helix-turn-helix transcriptional regulator [Ktedonobacteraceae bacterium]
MKKARDASPNRILKREREARCWSQLEVADRIGTTAFNVSRWERGITFPGSYFRQQLCLIFEKSPGELGFLLRAEDGLELPESDEDQHTTEALRVSEQTEGECDEPAPAEGASPSPLASPGGVPPVPRETLPAIWNVPYRRNPFFTGREETLKMLYDSLHPGEQALVQALAISGLGGIGKTQTALEYAYRHRHAYQAIFWARADTRELLITEFASIAELLALPEQRDQDQLRAVAAVKRWLSRQTGWLLVLDNADDLEMVSDFLPEAPGGHILLTTRAQNTGQIAQRVLMEKLNTEESVLLLLRRAKLLASTTPFATTSYDRWSQARPIAHIMDGLPLALDQAAAYIEETNCGLNGYAERYQKRRIALLSRRGGLRPDHPEAIAATWSLSFEKVEQAHPAAAELLRLCAFLHPDEIAEEMLIAGTSELTPRLRLLATDPFELDAAIEALTTFSLLQRDPERQTLTLHRLVQTVLREQMDEETRRSWAARAVQLVERAFPAVSFTSWEICQRYLPHALTCVEFIEQLHLIHPAALSLLNKAGSYLRERAQYLEAERLLTNALMLSETTLPADDPLLAESLNNLGLLAHDQGKYLRSEALLQRALTIYKQALGPEHIAVAQCLSNQAENYRVQVKPDQMEALAREALAIREKALGSEHPDVAKSLNQLAALYHGQSKYSLAEPLYQRALEIRQRALGADHIDVAESLNNLAYLYNALGKYARAEPLYQQALSFCEKHLGAHHMYTAGSLANLAEVYRARGEYTQAEQLHRQALHIREQTLGSNHPSCGKSLNWLAEIYLCQHSYQVSETLALQALEIWQKTVGQEHNYVAIGLDTLARLRRAQGSPGVAEPLVVRALAIFQKIWGNDSHVAGSLNTLAEIAYDQKAYQRAQELLQQALQIQEAFLGAEHPETARSLYNLAVLYTAQDDYHQAEDYLARSLAIRQQAFYPQHPDLIATRHRYEDLQKKRANRGQLLVVEENPQNYIYPGGHSKL